MSTSRRFRWVRLVCLVPLATLGAACSRSTTTTAAVRVEEDQVRREIRDLMTALTPPSPTALPVEKSTWHLTRKKTLERLRTMGPEYGLEALRVYREEPPHLAEVQAGLLDIAAHTAPEETTPILVQLVTVFGADLHVRTRATEFLGECAPEKALEVLEPILSRRVDGRTYPPEERLLEAWVTAAEKLKYDPVPFLSNIATDLQRTQDVRHLATRSLGRFDSPQSRQALQALMVESSGNSYIRRLATQSLKELLPKEEFCTLVSTIQEREADPKFIDFLESVLNSSCR